MAVQKSNLPFITQILNFIPRQAFIELVHKYGTDTHSKGFDSWTHLIIMIFAQLCGAESLRDLTGSVATAPASVQDLFMNTIPTRSTISYNNSHRSYELFEAAFAMMTAEIKRRIPKGNKSLDISNPLYSFDSTTISLCLSVFDWAQYRTRKGGLKIHTLLDNEGCLPSFIQISEAKQHDIVAARSLALPKGSIVAMDRAYIDYALFYRWTREGVFFVTRTKTSTKLEYVGPNLATPLKKKPLKKADGGAGGSPEGPAGACQGPGSPPAVKVLRDRLVRLSQPKARESCPVDLRLVVIKDTGTKRKLSFLTNNLVLPAEKIAAIYKSHWEVELFFKCIKQEMIVKSFLGVSENAVRIQIYCAMIAVLLVKFLKSVPEDKVTWNFSNLIHLLRLNLFTYLSLFHWLEVPHCDVKPPLKGDKPKPVPCGLLF
jgi:hypothetical protein